MPYLKYVSCTSGRSEPRKAIYLFDVTPCSPCGTILFRTKSICSKRMRIQRITETGTYQRQISNGEAVAVAMDGRAAGHTMTSMGKSLREAHRPTRSSATPKSKMRVGCWNIRTMYTVGKAAPVAREIERYRLD